MFISCYDKKMNSSLLGDQVALFFQKVTKFILIKETLTIKAFMSKEHSEKPVLKKDIANMFCHTEETIGREYFLQQRMKNAAKTY